jgi:predicted nucleotidyltransferase
MNFPNELASEHPGVGEWAILHGYRGSIAHGMYEPNDQPNSIDDKDTMAICVPPTDYYLGLAKFHSRGTQEIISGEWDIVVYEARKAFRLLEKGNPNVMSLLWLDDDLYIKRSKAGDHLISNRDIFVGRHVYQSFVGYAAAQIQKMERGAFKGYMGEKRKALVEEHGYDTKNAAHLIRLLRTGIEFLREGDLNVRRPDAAELLEIKHGHWTLEQVKKEAERLFQEAEEACHRSTLPAHPDADKVNQLCVEVVQMSGNVG